MITVADIHAARSRLGRAIYHSPCPHSVSLSRLCGANTYFKLENLQMTGSFKERGALNRLLLLDEAGRRAGVIAASAGNHAQGVAYHATRLGIRAVIVMPRTTPLIKVSNTRTLGGEVILHGTSYDEAYAHACVLGETQDLVFVHAFDDDAVIAGQGTIGLELMEGETCFDAVIVPIGGGGLIGGIAVAIKSLRPEVRIIGVEPMAVTSMLAALAAGRPVEVEAQPTIADGLAVRRTGERTLAIASRYVDEVVTVSEGEIASAILKLLEIEKTVVEGGGAAGLAALLSGKVRGLEGRNVAVIVCGGNIDPNLLSRIIERGLARDGRLVRLRAFVRDRPGELARICQCVADVGANIIEVEHDRAFAHLEVGGVEIDLTLETRGHDQIEELRAVLAREGIETREPA